MLFVTLTLVDIFDSVRADGIHADHTRSSEMVLYTGLSVTLSRIYLGSYKFKGKRFKIFCGIVDNFVKRQTSISVKHRRTRLDP